MGVVIGTALGPAGSAAGGVAGAALAALFAGSAGASMGAALGSVADDNFLDNRECLECGVTFRVDRGADDAPAQETPPQQ